jgi:Protein of unknown function (DUF3179)
MDLLQAASRYKRFVVLLLGLALAAVLIIEVKLLIDRGATSAEPAQDGFTQTRRYIVPQDPVTQFPVKTVHEAWNDLRPDELVLGVSVGAESRAYPLNVLNDSPDHKVLNDTLGGQPIAPSF